MEGPSDPGERVELLCTSMRRLGGLRARVRPLPHRARSETSTPDEARALVVAGLREVASGRSSTPACASVSSRRIPAQHDTVSFVNTVADALALLDEAGLPEVGIMADTYNLWHERPEALAAVADRVTGLHVADEPPDLERTDRVLPGEGGTRSAELIRALVDAGWDGYLDVEIFSTPERFWGLPGGRGRAPRIRRDRPVLAPTAQTVP